MKRTIEMITMTLIIIVVAAFVGSTLMGCGGDDDSIIAISNDDGVRGGEVLVNIRYLSVEPGAMTDRSRLARSLSKTKNLIMSCKPSCFTTLVVLQLKLSSTSTFGVFIPSLKRRIL